MEAFIEEGLRWWLHLWPHLITLGIFALDIVLSAHAILTKKDTRSTIAWVGLIWFSPGFGAIAYTLFGVNRIRSRATRLRAGTVRVEHEVSGCVPDSARLAEAIGPPDSPLRSLAVLVGRVTERPLTDGNVIEPLNGGDEAYPAMLEAIHGAKRSIGLSSYIFDNDPAGRLFVDALAAATRRGVAVRVLIDGIGSTYSSPPITGLLEAQGVPTATFLPATVPFFFPYANLRNHRKIMVVDGRIGFTGGLNIREDCWLSHAPRHPVRDMHFRLHGPVVAHLLEVFAEDWAFACGDAIDGDGTDSDPWRPDFVASGTSPARGIRFGPDDPHVGGIRLVIVAALAAAQKSVRIMTPYFLPDDALCQALDVAAMRGVQVDIVLPATNNLALVQWASTAMLWQVLERGCNVWMSPPPFDHTKLFVVDGAWAMFGSGNWDERSLRLNFEFNVETFDRDLCQQLDRRVADTILRSQPWTLADVDSRSMPVRLRDGVARLFSPYL
ncbi:MAG: cardiolipin synthase [Planctomycetota bacterium]|nr:MAG: cardiolipin synthase [Planctomycetota bacterium]